MTASVFSRSVVSNSRRLHGDRRIDGRSRAASRFRDLTISLAETLGGFHGLREGERAMVRSAAALMLRLEQQQAALAAGHEVDPVYRPGARRKATRSGGDPALRGVEHR